MGTEPVNGLLFQQAVPAAIGILFLSINGVVDTIFVGNWIGSLHIGAITVVMAMSFFISSLGMAIGIGGGSIISRAFGAGDREKALKTFGNQTLMVFVLVFGLVGISAVYYEPVLKLYGGKGELLELCVIYFKGILPGLPFLAWAMMSNAVFRAEGFPKISMITMLIPVFVNLTLDPILIYYLDYGLKGAAWATCISYIVSALFTVYYFVYGNSQMSFNPKYLKPDWSIIGEITSIGGVSFARQGSVTLFAIVINNTLFTYGSEIAVSAYGIIRNTMMLSFFPVFGVTQGFLPIAGFNFGAKNFDRVKEVVYSSIKYGTAISIIIFLLIQIFANQLVGIFTTDKALVEVTIPALRIVCGAIPLVTIQMIGSAYFQAIGKPLPALILTLQKQLFYLIPLVILLPLKYGLNGAWIANPIADVLTALVCFIFIKKALEKLS